MPPTGLQYPVTTAGADGERRLTLNALAPSGRQPHDMASPLPIPRGTRLLGTVQGSAARHRAIPAWDRRHGSCEWKGGSYTAFVPFGSAAVATVHGPQGSSLPASFSPHQICLQERQSGWQTASSRQAAHSWADASSARSSPQAFGSKGGRRRQSSFVVTKEPSVS